VPRSRSLVVLSATLSVLLALLVEAPALANTIVRTDGNDTKGPLDLASTRVTHGTAASVFRVTTLARFTNKQINGKQGFFEIDFDTNGDRNPNYFVVVLRRDGKMRGWLFKGNGDLITRKLAAARLSARSVRVTVPLSRIGNPQSYDFAAFSAFFAKPCTSSHPCIDSIPNRYPLVRHDLTAPTFSWNPLPPVYSSEVASTLAFPVTFSVADDTFGSGVDNWTLQKRAVGTSTWLDVATGASLNPTRNVTGVAEGTAYDLRVVVRDNQGNKRVGATAHTSVPYDDANVLFTYTGTWVAGPTTEQFLTGSHQGSVDDEVSFDVVGGQEFCILGGPGSDGAAADLVVGAASAEVVNETSGTQPREQIHCETPPGVGSVHVVLTITAGTFVLDGVAIAG
jgi:hypothetical protein